MSEDGALGPEDPGPIVRIEGQGDLQGRLRQGVARFLGIPYATAGRWRAPQPHAPWTGVFPQQRRLVAQGAFYERKARFVLRQCRRRGQARGPWLHLVSPGSTRLCIHPLTFKSVKNPLRLVRCPQLGPPGKTYEGHVLEDDENCLQLNVWTPLSALRATADSPKLPVLVYIHGGGGKSHSAHCPRLAVCLPLMASSLCGLESRLDCISGLQVRCSTGRL